MSWPYSPLLGGAAATAGGAVTHSGSGAANLPILTASGVGDKTRKGTGTPSLPPLTASGAGTKTRKGTGTPALPILTASGAGKKGRAGTGAANLPILTASGAGTKARKGTGAPSLPILTADGAGTKTRKGSGTPQLPILTASGVGAVEGVHTCNGDAVLPILTASGAARLVAVETGQTPAGRKRRKYVIEIDGREFIVNSPQEAIDLLARAEELAQRAADRQAETVISADLPKAYRVGKARPVSIREPRIEGPDEFKAELNRSRERIRQIYQDAALTAELRILMALDAERDDEEALLLSL